MTQKAFAERALSGGDLAGSTLSRLMGLGAGLAVALPLLLAAGGAAEAQQAYYFPQAGSGPVTVNYGALTPYGGPAVPGFYPYAGQAPLAQPRSVFTPQAAVPGYGAPAYGVPGYGVPAYATPAYQSVYGRPAYNQPVYSAAPAQAPFVAPYGNPAYPAGAPGYYAPTGYAPGTMPQSYLNVPGQAPVMLQGTPQPGAKPFNPASLSPQKSRKQTAEPVPSAVEEAAAAQIAAVEAQLESGPAPAVTPPEAPAEIPASVPSPADQAAVIAPPPAPAPAAPAPEAPAVAPESSGADSAAVIEPPAEEGAAVEAAAEAAPAEEAPAVEEEVASTGGAAALPAGGTRIVFEGAADELPAGASGELDAIAQRMLGDESIKVQVLAYSSSIGDNESQARRKALARGLEVRKYLIGKGVRSNRIDVRALGSKSEGSPADRVDIVPVAG